MKNQTLNLTLITPEDLPDLSVLMLRVWGIETKPSYWRWKYFDPPFETKGYAVKSETGKMRPTHIYGSIHLTWQLIDIMADPEYRSGKAYKVIAGQIDDLVRRQKKILLGFTNETSYEFFCKYFNDVLIINEVKKIYSLIINAGDLVSANHLVNRSISLINRGVVKMALILSKPSGYYDIEMVSNFSEDMNQLCKNIENQYDFIMERDVDYLNWRFLSAPHQNFQVWTAKKDRQLVGYMVTVLIKRSKKKVKGEIVDWLTPRQDSQAFKALLHHALNWFIQENASVVDIWNLNLDNRIMKLLKMNLFVSGRRNKSFLTGINHPEKYNLKSDSVKESFFTRGDAG